LGGSCGRKGARTPRASWEDGKDLGISPPISPGISGKFREKPPKTGVLGSCGQFQGPTPPFSGVLIPLRRQLSPHVSVYRGFTKGPGGSPGGPKRGFLGASKRRGFLGVSKSPLGGGVLGGLLGPAGIRVFAGQGYGRNEELQ